MLIIKITSTTITLSATRTLRVKMTSRMAITVKALLSATTTVPATIRTTAVTKTTAIMVKTRGMAVAKIPLARTGLKKLTISKRPQVQAGTRTAATDVSKAT
jgi:hypothetical protein